MRLSWNAPLQAILFTALLMCNPRIVWQGTSASHERTTCNLVDISQLSRLPAVHHPADCGHRELYMAWHASSRWRAVI